MKENVIKAFVTAVGGFMSSVLGVLYVPVLLMVSCNIIDYITGIAASSYRHQEIESYKGMKGITKKVCMWILVIVGAIIDELILYAGGILGITIPTFVVACMVAIWIVCNEIISILENLKDIGVAVPSFLEPLVKNIKSQTEDKMGAENTEGEK